MCVGGHGSRQAVVSFNARGISGTITFTEEQGGVRIQTALRGLRRSTNGTYTHNMLNMTPSDIMYTPSPFPSLPPSCPVRSCYLHPSLGWTPQPSDGHSDSGHVHVRDTHSHDHGHGGIDGYIWHVHNLPVDQTLNPAVQCLNAWVGPHYDPFDARSQGNYSTMCTQDTPTL